MAGADDIAGVIEQERALVFESFDDDAAFAIGSAIRDMAIAEKLGIVCSIVLWDRPLFYMTRPGTTADNSDWVRRKANVVRRFHKSSYRMVLEQLPREDRLLAEHRALPPEDYVLAGGGFPIRVAGAGVIGAIVVSGLPERRDHAVVVKAIAQYLGKDAAALALPEA
ncbi:UPF0303 protein [Youhaiella tibetensis]|uniref:UPF0303 protein FNA67_14480 n=1 Tax=Paradevosia tibetensis TaxID=1447062 RepID=A0A5B9DQ07_9HYPH|nr:heme-degrading domain-containing protein [Youhaiella tibetensis]QEE21317.1 heme-degrading domain-containing protein [Youhaiella tibetensis]GGF16054.1 UPF0303 protein [Youhaiella tibetensis]